jgi:HrpA-like RNA helicase
MAVALLLIAIAVSFVVVRIGAAALELTGVPWDHAKFQALSAFTNCGFTTRESEEVTRHPLRRRIASFLIVLGNAGLVTTVATLASSLSQPRPFQTISNIAAIAVGVAVIAWLTRLRIVKQTVHDQVQDWLARRYPVESWAAEDLLHLDKGFILTRFPLPPDSSAAGHTLRQLRLKQNGVQLLAVERAGAFHAVPRGEFELKAGDELVVYGGQHEVERLLQPGEDQTFLLVEDQIDSGS